MSDAPAWPLGNRLSRTARMALIVVGGTVLMTLAAKVQIPFWPVPMTPVQSQGMLPLGAAGLTGAAPVAAVCVHDAVTKTAAHANANRAEQAIVVFMVPRRNVPDN